MRPGVLAAGPMRPMAAMASPAGERELRRYHVACCLFYSALCVAWNAFAGRDLNVDQISYHLYVAFAWWQDRLPDELFAASAQGYLNPYPHLPFFAALSTGWPPLAVGSAMALLHGANLWLLHAIGAHLVPPRDRLHRLLLSCGVLLGALAPVFLIEVGGSFVDVIVSLPSLGALLYLLRDAAQRGQRTAGWRAIWLSGLLSGMAAGLKPSAVVFAVAISLAAVALAGRRAGGVFWRLLAGGLAGLALAGGPHALMLWNAFGNPVFPLFNTVFRSPWFPPIDLVSDRFRPDSLAAVLQIPLDMTDALSRSGLETIAVDYRPAWLLVLLLGWATLRIVRRLRRGMAARNAPAPALAGLALALFVPLWLYTSGNQRYALPLMMLVGPVIAMLALDLNRRFASLPLLAVGLPLAAQALAGLLVNDARWDGRPWSAQWYDWRIPERLRTEPAHYLSLQTQTYSAIALHLPAGSRFTNLVGQVALPPDGEIWKRVRETRQASGLPWRSLVNPPGLQLDGGLSTAALDVQDGLLAEYGLRADRQDCEWLELEPSAGAPAPHWKGPQEAAEGWDMQRTALLSCALVEAPPPDAPERARRARTDARFERWERRCPGSFAPVPAISQQGAAGRLRNYMNTESLMFETRGWLMAVSADRQRLIGLEDPDGRPQIDECPRLSGYRPKVQSR